MSLDTPQAVAAAVLEKIDANRKAFNMRYWASDYVKGDCDTNLCGTTMCVAGWVAHVLGYTILGVSGTAFKPGEELKKRHVDAIAQEALELTNAQAYCLFYASAETALRILHDLANGLSFPNELI